MVELKTIVKDFILPPNVEMFHNHIKKRDSYEISFYLIKEKVKIALVSRKMGQSRTLVYVGEKGEAIEFDRNNEEVAKAIVIFINHYLFTKYGKLV